MRGRVRSAGWGRAAGRREPERLEPRAGPAAGQLKESRRSGTAAAAGALHQARGSGGRSAGAAGRAAAPAGAEGTRRPRRNSRPRLRGARPEAEREERRRTAYTLPEACVDKYSPGGRGEGNPISLSRPGIKAFVSAGAVLPGTSENGDARRQRQRKKGNPSAGGKKSRRLRQWEETRGEGGEEGGPGAAW